MFIYNEFSKMVLYCFKKYIDNVVVFKMLVEYGLNDLC